MTSKRLVIDIGNTDENADWILSAAQRAEEIAIHDALRWDNESDVKDDWASLQWKAVDEIAESWEGRFADGVEEVFGHLERELMAVLSQAKAEAKEEKATVNWTWVGDKWKQVMQKAGDKWRETFVSLITGVVNDQGTRWATELGMQFNVRDQFAEEWLDNYVLKFAQPVDDTTSAYISEMLRQATEEGWGIPQMQNRLEFMFEQWMKGNVPPERFAWLEDRMPPYRREMIARTETHRASIAGSYTLFLAWGVEQKEWLGTPDNRIRPDHQVAWVKYSRGGKPGPIPMDKPFEVGGAKLMYPGDPDGPADQIINCRCALLPVVPGSEGLEQFDAQESSYF